jgi:exopolysaccharide biosynthesis polyprenyl glycosylphosphotransferase
MIERKHKTLATIYLLTDALASNLAMLSAYVLRFAVAVIPITKGMQELSVYTQLLPLVTLVFPLSFAVQGLYRVRPTRSRSEEWFSVAIGCFVGTVVLSGILLWIRPGNQVLYSRATLGIFLVCAVVFVIIGRAVVRRTVERMHRSGRNVERVLVAGNGELARAVVERVSAHRELGFQIVGYLRNGDEGTLPDLECLGGVGDASEIVDRYDIEHVFVALPHASSEAMMSLLDRLTRQCVAIHVIPDLLQFMALRSRVEDLDGLPTINLSETPLEGWNRLAKRLFDLGAASIALIAFSPVMLAISMAIWLEDRGPVFYRQVRMGLDGKPFEILKFRSMKHGAETTTGAVWAEKDDPRRTRVGRFIRAWSLDELPQLWNVLMGEMSVVGPRPERPQFVEQFRAEFPHYMLRHKVRAGMTGWAQVNGWRGNTSIRIRIEHDLYYIENWSLGLDFKILFMTIRHGLRHENAY